VIYLGFAIATRIENGTPMYRSTVIPPPEEDMAKAKQLGQHLSVRVPEIEKSLKSEFRRARGRKHRPGDAHMWRTLGEELDRICRAYSVGNARERQWLWEAIQNLYASDFIKKKERGRTRNHFEYCYQLAQFPAEFSDQINWSEWVYFFDSRAVREDQRTVTWLKSKVEGNTAVDRREFRRFIERLNKRIQKLDTSVLTDDELFEMYGSVWDQAVLELAATVEAGPKRDSRRG
jgi:hypothetical protein